MQLANPSVPAEGRLRNRQMPRPLAPRADTRQTISRNLGWCRGAHQHGVAVQGVLGGLPLRLRCGADTAQPSPGALAGATELAPFA